MLEIEISSDGSEDNIESKVCDINTKDSKRNRKQFEKMKKLCLLLCQTNKDIPIKYVEDIHNMYYHKCGDEKKNSTNLCNLVLEGIKHISPKNKNSFQYMASVYNELLQLSKKDSINIQTENCKASTSNDKSTITSKLENGTNKIEINKSNILFNEFIKKCYENPNFPNSNIKVVDNLYKSLPYEFVTSKLFMAMLEEASTKIWPDSGTTSYVFVEHIHDQLNLFKTSMKVQDETSTENKEINVKKIKMLNQLKIALKKVRKQIKKLDETEMDIDNENEFDLDSPYILKDKYEKRALKIYKQICKLRNEPDFLEEPPLRFKQTKYSLVNKTVERYYNLNKIFPNYFEIYTLLKLLNEKKNLRWTEKELKHISQDAFLKLGKQLKIQRLNEYFGRLADVTSDKDPAEDNPELKIKLDQSNQKLYADLNKITEKFNKDQDYAEETEGSSLNNTDCENSSEDNSSKNKIKFKKEIKKPKMIMVKRKRDKFDKLDNDIPPKKTKKTMYMESFDLTPCDVTLKEVNNSIKTVNGLEIENNSNKMSDTEKKNVSNFDINLKSNDVVHESSLTGDNNIPLIDKTTIKTTPKTIKKNKLQDLKSVSNFNETTATEPIVILNEDISPAKDIIEINELDDSDVEIMSSVTPKVPVQNKKSLESIIKSMNFGKKFKWGQPIVKKPNRFYQNMNSHDVNNHNLQNQNQSQNLVNCWIMNNTRPSSFHNNNVRPPFMNQNALSTFQNSTTQTARQVTQRVLNSTQHQKNFLNNQSVLSQRVTTMTTTTTVRQIVQQQSSRPIQQRTNSVGNPERNPVSSQTNKPELIELD